MRYLFARVNRFATRTTPAAVLTLVMLAAAVSHGAVGENDDTPAKGDERSSERAARTPEEPQPSEKDQADKASPAKPEVPPVKLGLVTDDPRAFQGYNLMTPLN